jgi:hypothetical protein
MFAELGTSRSSDPTTAERYPDPDDEMPPELLVARIVQTIMDVPGVANVAVGTPAADVPNSIIPGTNPTLLLPGTTSYVVWI